MRLSSAVKLAVAAAGIVAVAMIAASKSIDFERYKGYVAELVEAETGRKLTFGGPVKLRLGLVPSLIAENVSLSNVAGGSRPEMIKVERIEAEVALPALLRKEILIQRLIVSSPDILLEKGNWRLADNGNSGASGTPTRFNLRELKIKNARITWVDKAGGRQNVAIHKLVVVPEQGANAALGVTLVGDALGKTFEFTGKVGSLGAALAGKPWPLTVKGAMPGAIVSVDGTIGDLAGFKGLDLKLGAQADELGEILRLLNGHAVGAVGPMRLSARLNDAGGGLAISDFDASAGRRDALFVAVKGGIRDLSALSGVEGSVQVEADNLAHLGRLLGRDLPSLANLRLAATLRDVKGGWSATDLKLHVGSSDVSGEAGWHDGPRPLLKAHLGSSQLVVADFAGKAEAGDGRMIPSAPLPLDFLRGHDAELSLRADKLALSAVTMTGVTAEARLHAGQLAVEPLRAVIGGGQMDGSLGLDARPAQPTANLRLAAHDVDFGRLLREGGTTLMQGGVGGFKLGLRGRGTSLRALAASASGSALLEVGPGQVHNRAFTLAGGDLPSQVLGALNPLAADRDTTELSCAVAHFQLKDGLAASDRGIAVQTDGVDVVGSGTVNLRDESLDLGFTPRAKEGLGVSLGGQVAGLTRLRGSLAAPTLSVDEIGAARAAVSVGAAAATGGLSLLGELLFDKATADREPCRTALAMGAAPPAKAKAKGKDGGGGLLESLFGR